MAKQKQKDKSAWDRFNLWIKANEKVLFVILLALLGFSFAFGPQITTVFQGGGQSVALGHGRSMDLAEFKAFQTRAAKTLRLFDSIRLNGYFPIRYTLLGSPPTIPGPSRGLTPFAAHEMLVQIEIAKDMGLRVSDEELAVVAKRLWRLPKAEELANKNLEAQGVPQQDFQARSEETKRVTKALEEKEVFDPDEYSTMVKNGTGLRVQDFEDTLRDLLLLKKLGEYVTSSVAVDPKDVFARYNDEYHTRKLRWVEAEVPDALREEIRKSVAADKTAVAQRFEEERDQASGQSTTSDAASWMNTEPRIRFSWLRANREALIAKVESEVTDEKLKEAYEADRARYLKPGIFPEDAGFTLLSAEEQAARDVARYKPFEEVKDEVRRRYIKKTSNSELRDLATQLSTRLYPRRAPDSTNRVIEADPASFANLVKEWTDKGQAILTTGTTEFASRAEAEEVFGEIYDGSARSKIDRWFNDAPDNRYKLKESAEKNLKYATYVREETEEDDEDSDLRVNRFFLFFGGVEIRGGRLPRLEEVEAKVVDLIVNERINELLTSSIEKKIDAINAGTEKIDALAKGSIEVTSPSGATHAVAFGELQSHGKDLVRRSRTSARVMVADTSDDAKKALEENPNAVREKPHDSSQALHDAAFSVDKEGGVAAAPDDERGRFFVVQHLQRVDPDPGRFDTFRASVERSMVSERQNVAFTDWKRKVYEDGQVDFSATVSGAGG